MTDRYEIIVVSLVILAIAVITIVSAVFIGNWHDGIANDRYHICSIMCEEQEAILVCPVEEDHWYSCKVTETFCLCLDATPVRHRLEAE